MQGPYDLLPLLVSAPFAIVGARIAEMEGRCLVAHSPLPISGLPDRPACRKCFVTVFADPCHGHVPSGIRSFRHVNLHYVHSVQKEASAITAMKQSLRIRDKTTNTNETSVGIKIAVVNVAIP